MRHHHLRWFPTAIVIAVTVITATAWAKTVKQQGEVLCPGVDAGGNLVSAGSSTVLGTLTINEKTRAYHGTFHANVTNLSGRNVTFIDSPDFGSAPGEKTKYTVKANGNATASVSGIFPPAP